MSYLSRSIAAGLLACAAPAFAAPIDGNPQVNSASNKGTYIWRNDAGQVEVRTVAGRDAFTFSASFESAAGFDNTSGVGLESQDRISKSGNNADLTFEMWPRGVDGMTIRGAAASDLCLRQASGTNVYLGANATRANLPVDLSGNGACGGNSSSPDVADGLYVLRPDANTIQLRLVSRDSAQLFAGSITADKSYSAVTPFSLEAADELQRPNGSTINVSWQTWPGGQDGLDLRIANASVCLEESTGASVPIFMGETLDSATSVSTPVSLTGIGSCGATVAPPAPPPGRKYNVGHYVRLMAVNEGQRGMDQADQPGVTGVLKLYQWKDLEPTRGNYDFSQIQEDLDYLSSKGLQLIVMLQDKTFKNENPMPAYLSSSVYLRKNRPGGYTSIRWAPLVVERTKALLTALGNTFDSNPYFEGVSTQESAPGLDGPTLDATGYTPERYRDALIDVLTHGAEVMPTSRVFWYVNFFPRQLSYMAAVIDAVKDTGVVVGGPDVMPDEHALQAHLYPTLRSFQGQLPLLGQVEPICYHHEHADTSKPTKYWTMSELFNYAKNNLKVNYMIWVNFRTPDFPDSYSVQDAWPVIERNPTFN